MWRGTPGTTLERGWLPNIQGAFKVIYHLNSWSDIASGAFQPQGNVPAATLGAGSYCGNYTLGFSAENSCNVFSSSNTGNWVLPRSISVYMCIKYI